MARRILSAKNSLDKVDARQIEGAFRARLAVVEGTTTDPPAGRTPAEMPMRNADQEQGSIRKSRLGSIDNLPYPEPRGIRDHVQFVAKQP